MRIVTYSDMQPLKSKLKTFFTGKRDISFEDLTREFDIKDEDRLQFTEALRELETEEWISRTFCRIHDTEEYEPGEAQPVPQYV